MDKHIICKEAKIQEPDGLQPAIRCRHWWCYYKRSDRCCACCPDASVCASACANSPERCKLGQPVPDRPPPLELSAWYSRALELMREQQSSP